MGEYKPKSLREAQLELRRLIREATDQDEERLAVIEKYLDDYLGRAREALVAKVDEVLRKTANDCKIRSK